MTAVDSWRRLEAIRQAHQRDVNEASECRARLEGSWTDTNLFVCECGDPGCTGTVSLSTLEYETVRESPNHFVVASNHENPEVEWVVAETERFAVVETLAGEASKIALRTDPRALHSAGAPAPL